MAPRSRALASPTTVVKAESARRRAAPRPTGPSNRTLAAMLAADPVVVAHDHPSEREAAHAETSAVAGKRSSPRGRGGSSLPGPVRRRMESRTGVDLSGLRVHTDRDSATLARSLGAEAFTHGGNVFFAPGHYAPGTARGDAVLSHEIAHATSHDTGQVHLKRVKKHLDFVRMKRKETHIVRMLASKALTAVGADKAADKVSPEEMDHYGHWWIETGSLSMSGAWNPTMSYGWWPSVSVNIKQTLKIEPVAGELNQGEAVDPHHGEAAEVEFHPVMEVDDADDYATVRAKVLADIDNFAKSFTGSWNWRLAWGKNCHTFQQRMKDRLKLSYSKSKYWLRNPNAAAEQVELDKADLVKPWYALQGMGGFINSDPQRLCPAQVDADYMKALSDEQKQTLMDYIGVTAQDMDDFCQFLWFEEGKNIFT